MLLDVHHGAVGEVAAEKAGKGARVLGDGHLVVVENDDEAVAHASGLIQCLQRHAAGEGAVADDGHHMFLAAAQIAGRGHAERRGNGRGGVPHAEVVVGAFRAVGKTGKTAVAAKGFEAVGSAREQLPRIALMAHVPHYGVPCGIEAGEQGYGQFHHAERRGEMAAVLGDDADDDVTQLLRQFLLAGKGKSRNVFGKMQAGEQGRIDHGNP